ncbi:hypothetical protein [Bradyrhizobium diazoefficiens]
MKPDRQPTPAAAVQPVAVDLSAASLTVGAPTCSAPRLAIIYNLVAADLVAGHPRVGARRPHARDSQAWQQRLRARKAKNQADKRKRGRRRVTIKIGTRTRTFEWRDLLIAFGIDPRLHFFPDDVADALLDEIETKIFRHR